MEWRRLPPEPRVGQLLQGQLASERSPNSLFPGQQGASEPPGQPLGEAPSGGKRPVVWVGSEPTQGKQAREHLGIQVRAVDHLDQGVSGDDSSVLG